MPETPSIPLDLLFSFGDGDGSWTVGASQWDPRLSLEGLAFAGATVIDFDPNGFLSLGASTAPDALFLSLNDGGLQGQAGELSLVISDVLTAGRTIILDSNARTVRSEGMSYLLEALEKSRRSTLLICESEGKELYLDRDFLEKEPHAWRHLSAFIDEGGQQRRLSQRILPEMWAQFFRSGSFPIGNLRQISVFHRDDLQCRIKPRVDFVHRTSGVRKREYWVDTIKEVGAEYVNRQPSIPELVSSLMGEHKGSPSSFRHVLGSERYSVGARLSDVWLSAFAQDENTGPIEALFNRYYSFLKENAPRGKSVLLDLSPDNIIYAPNGDYAAIDQEWEWCQERSDIDLLFARGVLQFISRYPEILECSVDFLGVKSTKLDLFNWACDAAAVCRTDLLEKLDEVETSFRESVHTKAGSLDLRSSLNRAFRRGDSTTVCCQLVGIGNEAINIHAELPFSSAGGLNHFTFYCDVDDIRGFGEFRFIFDQDLGPVRFQTLAVSFSAPDDGGVGAFLELRGHEDIIQRASHIETGDDPTATSFPLGSVITKVCFALPQPVADRGQGAGRLRIQLKTCWPDALLGDGDINRLVGALWGKETSLVSSQRLVIAQREELAQTERKLAEALVLIERMKSSKVWRAGELLRRIIFSWRTVDPVGAEGRPAIEVLNRPAAPPAQRVAALLNLRDREFSLASESSPSIMISVVIPVHNTPRPWLADAIRSVQEQSYAHWELVLVDDGSTLLETREFLDRLNDPRVTRISLVRSCGISGATNFGIEAARGEVIVFMDHDDMLALNALELLAAPFESVNADIVYSDEAVFTDETTVSDNGGFGRAHLKPDFSPDLLLSHNYITHCLAVRKKRILEVGGLRGDFDGAQDYDLLLRLTEATKRVVHVPSVLYFWRQSVSSTSLDTGVKPEAHLRGKKALEEALERRGLEAEVLMGNAPHFFRVRRAIKASPMVDIIIPFRNQPFFLKQCLDSVISRTRYSNYRIVCVDNGSDDELTLELRDRFSREKSNVHFIDFNGPFNFSGINNFAASGSDAEHLVLMNNDIEIINPDWLEALLEHSQRAEVGAVGAKLFYPNDTIQHAGIAVGIGGYAGHPHKHEQAGFRGYLNRLNVIQNVSAVTAALLMCKRAVYAQAKGLDQENFGIACNDVDFCLRLIELGYRNIFTPYALAYHHESVSRGYEDTPEKMARFAEEKRRFSERHAATLAEGDPYYNRGFRRDTENVLIA